MFFADAPHLMKTTRNCMYHSGSGAGKTRLMWNDEREIVWNHLVKAVQDDGDKGLKLIIKLNAEHIRLNPYSKMIVRLATQVLSESVGKHLYTYHGPECHGTADLCIMMDKYFDLLNIKNEVQMTIDSNGLLTISCRTLKDGKRVSRAILQQLIRRKCSCPIKPTQVF